MPATSSRTADALTINKARTLANVAERARTLFADGYRAQQFESAAHLFFVFPPDTDKRPYIVDTLNAHCTCPFHPQHRTCKHRLAIEEELRDAARLDEQAEYLTFGQYLADEEVDDAERQAEPALPAYYTCTGQPVYAQA